MKVLNSRLLLDEIERTESIRPSSDAVSYVEKFLLPARHLAGEVKRPEIFRIVLNVKQFLPTELELKIVDKELVVRGEHGSLLDEHGIVSRKFTRKFEIPDDVDVDTFRSLVDRNGLLVIEAERLEAEYRGGKPIPIYVERSSSSEKPKRIKSAESDASSKNQPILENGGDGKLLGEEETIPEQIETEVTV
ncbi:hypothetical protein TNIN_115221 [Trichonephila inaurata madagascariensis]|uniref:SHSP domain-containing protein n=1 Tax=Trichonephila inaurata madagascariensis TaxID=2747483 RepID=A0A8X6ILA9_9ARAC|nr:hypothetical protein TNIN_115221 [Trichonephila inaurata madagascariensis]